MTQRRISRSSVKSVGRSDSQSRWLRSLRAYHIKERALCWSVTYLQSKGRRIVTIDCEATVSEAIAKLVQNNIGSLPVVDHDGKLIGIFSERDVLRIIHNRGESFGRLPVCDVMTRDPITCSLDDDVERGDGRR